MRKVCAILCWSFLSSIAFTQDYPRAELFAGYSYLNVDTDGGPRQNVNGIELAASGNFNNWFGLETDVSSYYKSFAGGAASVTTISYMAGPRFDFSKNGKTPFFFHTLLGFDRGRGAALGYTAYETAIAASVGGGAEWRFASHLAVRSSVDYVFTNHVDLTQNNFRAGIGIAYIFGSAARRSHPAEPQTTMPTVSAKGMSIPALGVMATLGRSGGAEITDEAPNSIAALAGMHPGDVINALDGHPVKTPMELSAGLATYSAGDRIRIGYMVRGEWQSETVVVLGQGRY
jgi:hypothetical protein